MRIGKRGDVMKMDDATAKEVFGHLGGFPTASLATLDNGRPRVRPVTLVHKDGSLFVLTGSGSKKVRQLRADPRYEICVALKSGKNEGYLRADGRSEVVKDAALKAAVAKATPFFGTYWKSVNDPSYALIRLHVKNVNLMRPGEMEETRFEV